MYFLKDYFGTLVECVDYAGFLIFKYPQFSLYKFLHKYVNILS